MESCVLFIVSAMSAIRGDAAILKVIAIPFMIVYQKYNETIFSDI